MNSFSNFFSSRGPRHRGHGFTDTHQSYRRKKLNLVPDTYKTDHSKNQNIERLKEHPGSCVCTKKDLEFIRDTYNIIPHKDAEQKLGKTGITISYNPENNTFVLKK